MIRQKCKTIWRWVLGVSLAWENHVVNGKVAIKFLSSGDIKTLWNVQK